MKTQDAIDHFGNASKLAKALRISKSAVSRWGEYVPHGRQYELYVLTGGALRPKTNSSDHFSPNRLPVEEG